MLRGKSFVECFSVMKANSLKNICFLKLYLPIYGCGGSLLLRGLFSSCSEWELLSSCGARASHCGGLSCGARTLGHTGFGSYGTQT